MRQILVVTIVAFSAPLAAQGPVIVAPAARSADAILTAAAARGFAGVALIMKDGAAVLRQGYGLAQREANADAA